MQMESHVSFLRPQNAAGVSQENGVAVISQPTEVNGDQFSNIEKH